MTTGTTIDRRRPMSILVGAILLVAACAPAGGASPSAAPSEPTGTVVEVALANDATLGDILVGPDGKTLYIFTKDTGGTSTCTGECATNWPPLVVEADATVQGGAGVTGALATITRDDGALQVTYDGRPLYYFAADAAVGDVMGQGVGGVWFVVPPTGDPTTSAGGGTAESPAPSEDEYTRGGGATPAAAGGAGAASIEDFAFQPGALTVAVGSTVTWTNDGAAPHTVTADDDSFDSERLASGETFSQTFATAGTYAYHCDIHPQMTGTIEVTP